LLPLRGAVSGRVRLLEKLLEGALIKLSSAVSSLARTKTARGIIEAVAGGQRDPRALAALGN